MALINWLLKFKMHANTYIFLIFSYMKISYKLKRLGRMHGNKTFCFCFSI